MTHGFRRERKGPDHRKNRIRTIALMLATAGISFLMGCMPPAEEEELIRVGIVNNDPEESGYRAANDEDLRGTFTADNGYAATFLYGSDAEEQMLAVRQLLLEGVDYILLSAADASGWDGILQMAADQNVTVILFDRTIDADPGLYAAMVVSDMKSEGVTATKWLAEQNLEECRILHLMGQMGSSAQLGRSEALLQAVEAHGWEVVAELEADWDEELAYQATAGQIAQGISFNVIYAENDDMARGAVTALDEAGITHGINGEVMVISFDCNDWALAELLNGRWNYDVQCNPFQADTLDGMIRQLEAGEALTDQVIYLEENGFDARTITRSDVLKYGI